MGLKYIFEKVSVCSRNIPATIIPENITIALIVFVAHKVHSWMRFMITFLLQWCTLKLPVLWTLANRDEASSWLPAGSFHTLCPKGHSNKVLLSSLVLKSYGWGGAVYGASFLTDSERYNPFLVGFLVAYDVSPLWYGIKFLYVTLAQLPCPCMPSIPRKSQLIIHSGDRSVLNNTVLFVLDDTSLFWFFGPLESPYLCSGLSLPAWGRNRRECFRGT